MKEELKKKIQEEANRDDFFEILIGDAKVRIGDYGRTPFSVYYAKEPTFSEVEFNMDNFERFPRIIEAENKENVFMIMQGEMWSPNGEANEIIRSLGLHHTSMSVGDVVLNENTGEFFMVDRIGFKKIQIG